MDYARKIAEIRKEYGGGGSRTLVPWQVSASFYVRRSKFVVILSVAYDLATGRTSPSCVLTNVQETLTSEQSAK